MKPYDWCHPACPDPCTCQETIEENIRIGPVSDDTRTEPDTMGQEENPKP